MDPYTLAGAAVLLPVAGIAVLLYLYGVSGARRLRRLAFSPMLRWASRRLYAWMASRGRLNHAVAADSLEYWGPYLAWKVLTTGCPGEVLVDALREEGYYEALTRAYSMGCDLPGEVLEEAYNFHVLAGQREFLRVHGEPRRRAEMVTVYCGRGRVEAFDGERVYSTEGMTRQAVERLTLLFDPERLRTILGAPVALTWGCHGDTAGDVVFTAYPEIPPSTRALAYHLSITQQEPSRIIAEAVKLALRVHADSGSWEKAGIPRWMLQLAGAPNNCRIPEDTVVITDNPRAGCRIWAPYRVEPGDTGDPRVDAALVAMAHRDADPASVYTGPGAGEWRLRLASEASARLRERGTPGAGGFEVTPANYRLLQGVPSGLRIEYRCTRPRAECAWEAGLDHERVPVRVEALGDPEAIRGVHEAAAYSLRAWPGQPLLFVAPSKPAAWLVSRTVPGSILVDTPWGLDDPVDGHVVVDWETLASSPWLLAGSRTVVHLFPEAYPGAPEDLAEAVEWLQSMAATAGRRMVTRLASALRDAHLVYPEGGEPVTPEPGIPRRVVDAELDAVFARHWGYARLRGYQRAIARAVVERSLYSPGDPVFTVLPTGSGKSAIFQVAGLALKRLGLGPYVLVVSPLRALMRDQVEGARRRGFRAERIDASTGRGKRARILDRARHGLVDLLYVTPERFQSPDFSRFIVENPPALVVLDEAHTIIKWGASFRPSYLDAVGLLSDLRREEPWPPVALFTATATPSMIEAILDILGSRDPVTVEVDLSPESEPEYDGAGPVVFRGPVVRPELRFEVRPVPDGEERVRIAARTIRELAAWSKGVSDPWIGIVFTGFVRRTRKEWANAEELASRLSEALGEQVIAYHGQLPGRERRRREDAIYEASTSGRGPRIVVATKAFGMGVDIPNIRWVLHFTPSDSIEDYYQEAGRAGRDGLPARIVTFYNPGDFEDRVRMARAQRILPSQIVEAYNTIARLWSAIREETGGSPTIVLPAEALGPQNVSVRSLDMLERLGYLTYWTVRTNLAAYKFAQSRDPSDYLPWYMDLGKRIIIGPEARLPAQVARRVPLRFERCLNQGGPSNPILVRAGDRELSLGRCSKRIVVDHRPALVAVVDISIDKPVEEITILPPLEYAIVVRSMRADEEKVEALHRLLEEALQYKDPSQQDATIRRGIEEYFQSPTQKVPEPPSDLLGYRMACPHIRHCIRPAAEALATAVEWLGPHGVTLAVQDEEYASVIIREYTRITGRAFQGYYENAYRRVVASSRAGPHRLMNHGFTVAVVRSAPRPSVLLDRLAGYPYAAVFSYASA